jgi:hypothetical protein
MVPASQAMLKLVEPATHRSQGGGVQVHTEPTCPRSSAGSVKTARGAHLKAGLWFQIADAPPAPLQLLRSVGRFPIDVTDEFR